MLHGEHAACAAHAGLNLVGHEQHAVLVAQLPQGRQETRRRNVVAAFALDGFDKNGGHFVRRRDPLQDRVFDLADADAFRGDSALRTAAGKGNVMDVRDQGREAAAMNDLRAAERHGPVGASVERSQKGDDVAAAGVPAGQLQSRFQRFRPAIGEEDLLRRRAGSDGRQPFRQGDLRLVVEIGAGHVQKLVGLVLDGGGDVGMTMAGGGDGDAGREVEEQIAVHVLDHRPAAPGHHQRIAPGVGRRHDPLIPFQQCAGLRSRQFCTQMRDGPIIE